MSKILYSFAVIFFGLSLGILIRFLDRSGCLRLPISLDALRKGLQKVALLGLNPVAIVGAIWIVRIEDTGLVALPLVGFFALSAGGLLALGGARLLDLTSRKTGAFFGCGSFTNIGAIGALVCYVFLGEAGFALVPLYKIFEEIYYYAVGFPIAKYYSGASDSDIGGAARLKSLARDPFIIVAVSSLFVGGAFNFSGLQRPAAYGPVNALVVPLVTILLLASIGMALRFSRVGTYMRESVFVSLIKFILVPLFTSALAWFLGFGEMQNGLPLKVVIILSSMPVAFNALIPPSIYDLDLDLANSCWFVTTALLVVVLPVLLLIIGRI